ncbi:MAG: FAD-dependent oxidoreductase, partial [Candidatus Bathyarchaeota archaeon]|nr:FAD-dependent oxidoreductase [Candidatus Bathyarchaeota archaeon]
MRENNLKGSNEERIGVFICHCGTNIAGFVDVKRLIDYFSRVEGVVAVEEIHLCSDTGLQKIKDTIKNGRLNRVVVATCTPKLHGELFKKVVEESGINRGFLQIANIREQCSWVHWQDTEKATTKALDLIEMAVSFVKNAVEIKKIRVSVEHKVLILGGGVAGITAALNLAKSGLKVILAEKTGFLGGHMAKWDKVFPTLDCSICILGPLMSEVYS